MRTTMNTIYAGILSNLNSLNSDMNRINSQISSGRQMSKISDDPVNLVSALSLRSSLAEIGQYQDNLLYGNSMITAAESSLTQIKDLTMRAKTLDLQLINDDKSIENRQNAAVEIHQMYEEAIILANTQINGKYIFGGYRTSGYTDSEPAPFVEGLIDGYRLNGDSPEAFDAISPPAWIGLGSLADFDLKINGINIPAASDDGYSTIYADSSAEAIANAINSVADQTGVTAGFTPVSLQASGAVEGGTMDSGDLIINGVDIFTNPTSVIALDTDNVLMDAINAKEAQTGIMASRDASGALILSPTPLASPDNPGSGRNLHVETSVHGEQLSHLNGSDPVAAASKVYMGSVQLHSDRSFILESTPFGATNYEAGLEALGVAGGVTNSGEPGDVSGDGRIAVQYIPEEKSNVRYCGDRENDIQIKVGKLSTIDVTKNGQDAIMDLGVFDAFTHLEDALKGINFRTVTGIHQAADLNVALDSGATGLEVEDSDYPLASGSLEITVTDHSYSPPRPVSMEIPIDITEDTLNSVATKINGVPGLMASWDDTGHLQINTTDEGRYTFSMTDKYSNFLRTTGTDFGQIQHQALDQSLTELDELLDSLTTQITDFGARANRLQVQSRIYENLKLSTAENLSEKQDTDMIEALMELKAKEVAYQAALSAAARTMQISLVDYL